ncbi:cardiolipin synthase [Microvirga brassicacearum]|uniref:Cardiolipin synthase n=1 Tax=Microvirga brassicacearum TaxID=2580413 RepID=A0A5N3P787_9HYPH|nr:cardiolipin synthase [Microvirga brassicacearum]KAB0265576.1 cardiolipin synthase [Microvirga brassicacearum]
MTRIGPILSMVLALYALGTGIFLISENRRPQATLAWMLVFFFAPGIGVLVYILFGRGRKAFSKRSRLLKQDLEGKARPLLEPILARQDAEIARLEGQSPSRKRLMMLVRRNSRSGLSRRNRVQIQQDAAVFYPSLIDDMKAARHSIHLQYFIWAADSFGESLKRVLTEKARAGIRVRLLYDPLGSRAHLGRGYIRDLRAAGAQMVPTSRRYQLHTISYRNHRKITVIDGRIGYTGGMNIGQEHLDGGEGFDAWRDTQVRIEGEGAALLQAVFMVDWYNATKENLFSEDYFPSRATEPSEGEVPVQILTSGPDSQWAAIRQLYFAMIAAAQHHVYLQSPYFIVDASIAEALKAAALSGVDVKVMLTARASGNPVPGWAGNTFILDVIDAGVRVFLYEKGYLHAKTISIDSEICSIGSTNIDIRSFSINYEINAVLYSSQLAKDLERDFQRDLAHCTEFDPGEYLKRRAAVRFRDSVARLLSPLL